MIFVLWVIEVVVVVVRRKKNTGRLRIGWSELQWTPLFRSSLFSVDMSAVLVSVAKDYSKVFLRLLNSW